MLREYNMDLIYFMAGCIFLIAVIHDSRIRKLEARLEARAAKEFQEALRPVTNKPLYTKYAARDKERV